MIGNDRCRNILKILSAFVFLFFLAGSFFPVPLMGAKSSSKGRAAPKSKSEKKKKKDQGNQASAAQETDDVFFDNAWKQFDLGTQADKKAAIGQLEKRVKTNPSDGTAHYYLGLMYTQDENPRKAEEHLRAAQVIFGESPEVLFKLGEVLVEKKKTYDEAVSLFEKVLTLSPDHAGALSFLGRKTLDEKNYDKAIEMLTKSKAGDPENRATLKALGKALFETKRNEEAVDILKKALAFDDSDAELHWMLGKAYEGMGKVKEAAAELEKAKSLGKKEINIKGLIGYDLARALRDMGKFEEAIEEYRKAIKVATEPAIGWFEIAQMRESKMENDQAIEAYKKAYELDKKKTEAQFRVGKILRTDEKLKDSITAQEAIRKSKDEWGPRAEVEIQEMQEILDEQDRELKMDIATTGSEKDREKALLAMLAKDKKDRFALEGLRDFYVETGNFHKSKGLINEMKRAGVITKEEAETQIEQLQTKFESGADLDALENAYEDAKRHGDWDTAIEKLKRIEEEAKLQLTMLQTKNKTRGEIYDKPRMIKLTKLRIRKLQEEMKDLQREKNKYK